MKTAREELYLLDRMAASVARAEATASSRAKLAYFELAGRYSVAALAALAAGRPGSACFG
jgi:hypothetical protein